MNTNLRSFFKDIWIWLKNNPFRAYHIVDESKTKTGPGGFQIFGTIRGGSTSALFNGVAQLGQVVHVEPFSVPRGSVVMGPIKTGLDLEFAMDKAILHRVRKPLEAKIAACTEARTGDLVQ